MKKGFIIFILANLFSITTTSAKTDLDTLYQQLDKLIGEVEKFDNIRQTKIAALKRGLETTHGNYENVFNYNNQIAEAYRSFNYDSVYVYVRRNLELAKSHQDAHRTLQMQMQMAQLYASAGSYLEAMQIINSIDKSDIPDDLMTDYCRTCTNVYGEVGNYTTDQNSKNVYFHLAGQSRRELIGLLNPKSTEYLRMSENNARNSKDYELALKFNDQQLKLIDKDSPEYASVAYFRSWDYKNMGDKEMEKYWLLKSAICDIKNATKDQTSLWTLAKLLSDEGDVERSYRYMRTSQEGLQQYNTPLRKQQSVSILSMIDHNYQVMTDKQNSQLKTLLLVISILTLLLIVAVVYVFRQMRRLSVARKNLHEANGTLTELNQRLESTVSSLHKSNAELTDSNKIKEMYIGHFLALCAVYLQKLESFRNTVLKKARSGQLNDYLADSKMREMKDKDLNDFMHDFDRAFLCIVPTFVEDFNRLLLPEGQITPPKDELLTTELRIFALIRMGISDSSQIAKFLQYSVNTIYNYRAKVKNYAVGSRDDFENEVRMIGNPE